MLGVRGFAAIYRYEPLRQGRLLPAASRWAASRIFRRRGARRAVQRGLGVDPRRHHLSARRIQARRRRERLLVRIAWYTEAVPQRRRVHAHGAHRLPGRVPSRKRAVPGALRRVRPGCAAARNRDLRRLGRHRFLHHGAPARRRLEDRRLRARPDLGAVGLMALTFYYASGSPYAWRVWLALEHKRIGYELKTLSFSAGDLRKPEFSAINPR